ncbi:MAG: site-specific integrase [Prevotella sp.]|nr:site-specific integrase [Prevotella sp.]
MSSVKLRFNVYGFAEFGAVYFQVTHKREVRQVKTRHNIYSSEWDKKKKCIIFPQDVEEKRKKKLSVIKEKLQWEQDLLYEIIGSLEERDEPFKMRDILLRYKAALVNKVTMFEYFDMQVFRLKKLGKSRTAECYESCANSFKKFRNYSDMFFDMLDSDIIEFYETYLRNKNLCRNTTSFYIRTLRSIFHKAVVDGYAVNADIFNKVYTGVDKTTKRAITLEEIKQLKNLDLSYCKILDFARDMFMFSFYTRGMSFIDIAYLRRNDVNNGYLTYNRRKTGQQLTIKWRDEMDKIVHKYNRGRLPYLFPIIVKKDGTERKQYRNKMQLVNRLLKELARIIQIDTPLTMYVARHSWASIAHDSNIPTSIISIGMGHDSETTTEIYLASISSSKVDDANDEILSNL